MKYLVFYNEKNVLGGRDYQVFDTFKDALRNENDYKLSDQARLVISEETNIASHVLMDQIYIILRDGDCAATLTSTPELRDALQVFIYDYYEENS